MNPAKALLCIVRVAVKSIRFGALLAFALVCVGGVSVCAQQPAYTTDSLYIRAIHFYGNKVTKERSITRELAYRPGTRIASHALDSLLRLEREKLFNTNLFNRVEVRASLVAPPDTIELNISLAERWFVWPRPILEPADRSFSEWWNNRGGDLSRVNYGLNYKQQNIGGSRKSLSLTAQLGFVRRLSMRFNVPFIDQKQRTSLALMASYEDNNAVSYITQRHKFVEVNDPDNVLVRRYHAGLHVGRRNKFYTSHHWGMSFRSTFVNDTVPQLNPDYFLDGRNSLRYMAFNYQFTYDRRDLARYPLRGHYLSFGVQQLGLGIFNELNLTRTDWTLAKFFDVGHSLYFSTLLSGKISFPRRQPYAEFRALGYQNNLIRGLDNFVVEGQHAFVWRNTLRWQLLDRGFDFSKLIPIPQLVRGDVAVYPKLYADGGYLHNSFVTDDNRALSNRPIGGAGIGIDIVLYRNIVFQFEYSVSSRGDRGLFINNNPEIR